MEQPWPNLFEIADVYILMFLFRTATVFKPGSLVWKHYRQNAIVMPDLMPHIK